MIATTKKLVVQAGAQLDDWGTPDHILELVREIFGGPIGLDLATNEEANARHVRAERYFTKESPPFYHGGPLGCPNVAMAEVNEVVWCNPPGPVAGVKRFWEIWKRNVEVSTKGAFLIFNLDHWRALETPDFECWVMICRNRLKFVGAKFQYNHPSAVVFHGVKYPQTEGTPWVKWGVK